MRARNVLFENCIGIRSEDWTCASVYCAAGGLFFFCARADGSANGSSCAITGLGLMLVDGGVRALPAVRVIRTGIVKG